jgi:outer membrane protein
MKHTFFIIILTCGFEFGVCSKSYAVTLKEAYSSALKHSDAIGIQRTRTAQAESALDQGQSLALPKVALSGSYTRLDDADLEPLQKRNFENTQTAAKIGVVQPLFRGFRDYYANSALEALVAAQKDRAEQAKIDLYLTVAEAYFAVQAAEKDEANLKALYQITTKRQQEIAARTKIGKSRKGELLSAEALSASLQAQLAGATNTKQTAREALATLTALPTDANLEDDATVAIKTAMPLEEYLTLLKKRPDLLALEEEMKAESLKISGARGAHYPTLDLFGNYYLKRPGALEESRWDAGLSLTIPIYEGGLVSAQVESAIESSNEKQLLYKETRRRAELILKQSYNNVQSGFEQVKALEVAVKAADANYQEQNRDYRYGLVTNLEVISALNTLQETRRNLDRQRYLNFTNYATLQATVGILP